jgi:hypothetical protein
MLIHFCSPPYAKIIAKPEGTFSTLFAVIVWHLLYHDLIHLSTPKYEQPPNSPNSIKPLVPFGDFSILSQSITVIFVPSFSEYTRRSSLYLMILIAKGVFVTPFVLS